MWRRAGRGGPVPESSSDDSTPPSLPGAGLRDLQALDPDRAPARVEAQRVAALAEAAREAAAGDLALHADRKFRLDRVAGGLDREVRVRIHRDLDPSARRLERAAVLVPLRERRLDPA